MRLARISSFTVRGREGSAHEERRKAPRVSGSLVTGTSKKEEKLVIHKSMHPHETVPLTEPEVGVYAQLREGVVCFSGEDTGHLNRHLRVAGAKAGEVITGLVTNDVLSLPVLGGQYAAALTPKSRVVADLRIVREAPEEFVVSADADCFDGWFGIVRKFVNPRLAAYAVDGRASIGLYGAGADDCLATLATDGQPPGAAPFSAAKVTVADVPALVIRSPALGEVAGVEMLVEAGDADRLREAVGAAGGVRGTRGVWEVARIEALRPRCGVDMDETTLPQEAHLDTLGAISFNKGCYTGQETVARIHVRGHVNRHLRLLHAGGIVPRGAVLTDAAGTEVGEVRSVGVSPRAGVVALAMVRREVVEGALLQAGGVQATIIR